MEQIRVDIDRINGYAITVDVPEERADVFQNRMIEYAKMLSTYLRTL